MTDGQDLLYTGKILPVLFSASDLMTNLKQGELNYILKFIYKNWEWVNSRLGESVSDLYGANIRLGEFKAVYSKFYNW